MTLRYGCQLPAPSSADLQFADYIDATVLPPAPAADTDALRVIPRAGWGVLGNDEWGCCVIAGGYHEHLLWNTEADRPFVATTANALATSSAITGFDPNAGPPGENPTDQGTDPRKAADYRRDTGIVDAHGQTHKIAGWVAVNPANRAHMLAAIHLFGAVGLAIAVPQSAEDQFHAGQPWTPVPGAEIIGGHYVPDVAYDTDWLYVVTWGQVQPMSWSFLGDYCQLALAYVSEDMLANGESPDGFDLAQLRADLAAVRG